MKRALALLGMVGLFAIVGKMVANSFYLTILLNAELPYWESELQSAICDASGFIAGGALGAVLHYLHFRRRTAPGTAPIAER